LKDDLSETQTADVNLKKENGINLNSSTQRDYIEDDQFFDRVESQLQAKEKEKEKEKEK